MTDAPDRGPVGQRGREGAGSAGAPEAGAKIAELTEAQLRLRSLLAVNQSMVTSRSVSDVAQHLVEAACATAGAGYARLELDPVNGSAAHVLDHAADPGRLACYRLYVEQQTQAADDFGRRSPRGELSEFRVTLDDGGEGLGRLQVLDREDFARQATVALELAEARSARDRLERTEAREVVARELHDDVIQRLFGVGLSLQGVNQAEPKAMQQHLQQAVRDLDATVAQIRETIFALRHNG